MEVWSSCVHFVCGLSCKSPIMVTTYAHLVGLIGGVIEVGRSSLKDKFRRTLGLLPQETRMILSGVSPDERSIRPDLLSGQDDFVPCVSLEADRFSGGTVPDSERS